jgi:ABC-2 type transport system ATP-binding protein
MEEPLVKIEHISKAYGRRLILKDINLEIRPGEIIGIIGSSGSGKTTFLNTLIGFIKPDSGDVLFRQPKLVAGSSSAIYKSVYSDKQGMKNIYGFAAQVPSFYEKLTVRENLEYFGQLYGLSKETLQANVNTLLKLMNLENSQNILGKNLSGGMERRLDIACSMVHNPQVLILDEPTADLDPVLRNNIWHLVEQINAKGTTIILSSHHLNELETLCSRIAILKNGVILDVGTANELKTKFSSNQEIRLESYPGNYAKLGTLLMKRFKDKIVGYENRGNELMLMSPKPHEILNDLIKTVESQHEKILELKLVKPSLDQVFISLNEKK